MSDRIIIIQGEPRPEKAARPRGLQIVGHDVWRFGEIKETLWGKGPSARRSNDVWNFSGIRKQLWGR